MTLLRVVKAIFLNENISDKDLAETIEWLSKGITDPAVFCRVAKKLEKQRKYEEKFV